MLRPGIHTTKPTTKRTRPAGACALCGNVRPLCNSHLLPKAAFRLLQILNPKQEPPLLMDEDSFTISNKQITAYLLCDGCEAVLRANGEDWVLANCYRGTGDFAIAAALAEREPDFIHGNADLFATDQIAHLVNADAIIHFACGVLWKAAAHTWRPGRKPIHLDLAEYTEPLRRFVAGEASFPPGLVLRTRVSTWQGDISRLCAVMHPPESGRTSGFWSHRFAMLGLTFELLVGSHLPDLYYQYSTAPSRRRFLIMSPEEDFLQGFKMSMRYSRLQNRVRRRT